MEEELVTIQKERTKTEVAIAFSLRVILKIFNPMNVALICITIIALSK